MLIKYITLILGLSFSGSISCMDVKNGEQKSHQDFDKHIVSINQTLQKAGLIPDICKIIGQYDGWRLYHQFDRSNGAHTDIVSALTYMPDCKYLASCSYDETIKLWDLDKDSKLYRTCVATFYKTNGGHTGDVLTLIYMPDCKYLASGSGDETIKLWDMDKDSKTYKHCVATFNKHSGGHTYAVNALAYIPDYKYLASGSTDTTIKLWDLDKDSNTYQTCIATFDERNGGHIYGVYALAYIPDCKYLASGYRDGIIKLWDLDKNSKTYQTCIATFNRTNGGHIDIVFALAYIPDIKYLASGSRDDTIKLWDLDKNSKTYQTCVATFNKTNGGHINDVLKLIYIKDIKCLASGSRDDTIKLWDLDKNSKTYQTCVATFNKTNGGHTSNVDGLAYISEFKCLASGSFDTTIKLWINMKDALGNFVNILPT